jgi:hypothetical protein
MMEREQKPQTKRPSEREEVSLDRRYGEIGIRAVNAAVRKTPNPEVGMTSKQQSDLGGKKKVNCGQLEASRKKERETEFKHVGELSKQTQKGRSTKR